MRIDKRLTKTIVLTYGNDHALGYFFEVRDSEQESEFNEEGVIFMFDQLFGIWQDIPNLIGVTPTELNKLMQEEAGAVLEIVTNKTMEYAKRQRTVQQE